MPLSEIWRAQPRNKIPPTAKTAIRPSIAGEIECSCSSSSTLTLSFWILLYYCFYLNYLVSNFSKKPKKSSAFLGPANLRFAWFDQNRSLFRLEKQLITPYEMFNTLLSRCRKARSSLNSHFLGHQIGRILAKICQKISHPNSAYVQTLTFCLESGFHSPNTHFVLALNLMKVSLC